RPRARCRWCWWCTRTAGSARTSKTSRGAWHWTTSSPFAPDALFPLGGYPSDEDKARDLFATLDLAKTRADFVAAANAAKALPEGNGKLGVVGFCWGGGIFSAAS